jgi:hypothetical protein
VYNSNTKKVLSKQHTGDAEGSTCSASGKKTVVRTMIVPRRKVPVMANQDMVAYMKVQGRHNGHGGRDIEKKCSY